MSSLMKKLGLGVLGLGEGRSIISAGVNSPLWSVVRLCDLSEDLGKARCAEFGLDVTVYTSSLEAMLADPAVDAVGIYTPDHLHADHVIQTLKAGKHVICTKPFLHDLSRAREVLDAQKASGKQVFVGQSSRFSRRSHGSGSILRAGRLATSSRSRRTTTRDHRWFLNKPWAKKDAFKWLYGCISHPGDLVRWYLPDIEEVMGYSSLSENGRSLGLAHPDTFHFVMKATNGITARVSGSYSGPVVPLQRDSNMSCILRCSKGASQGDYYDLRYAWKIGSQSVVETFEDKDDYYFRFGGHSHHAGEYQNYIEYFARTIAEGKTPKPDAREGIVTVALMQAMEESTQIGRPVKIKELLGRFGLADLVG